MEQQAKSSTLAEQAESLLLKGQPREAADEYARVATLDPNAPGGHLGVAEANLALGQYGMAYAAARHVQQIAPQSTEATVARAILALLDRRYDVVLRELDQAASAQPGNPYIHAMRGYAFRRLSNSYDASLAESKAARLSGNRELDQLFPKVEQLPAQPTEAGQTAAAPAASPYEGTGVTGRVSYQQQRPWSQRSPLERQMARASFATRNIPIVTYTLIAINVLVYGAGALFDPAHRGGFAEYQINSVTHVYAGSGNPVYDIGIQQGLLMQHDPMQYYRIVSAMFLHASFMHILLNMISLLSVGIITERIFGRWRFLTIYFVGGIVAGFAQAFFTPEAPSLGASGAIFAIFGAFGAFILLRRRVLGPAANSLIGQWVFFLLLNLAFSFAPGIGLYDHLGGLITGFLLAALFVSTAPRSRRVI